MILLTNGLMSSLVPVAVFVYLIVGLLKKKIAWLRSGIGKRLVPFLPIFVGIDIGAIPGLIRFFMSPFSTAPVPWHVSVMIGGFGGLLSHALHGWISKGLRGE